MNYILFSTSGGFPTVQETVDFLQQAWIKGFEGIGRGLSFGQNKVILLEGCEIVPNLPLGLTIKEGTLIWTEDTVAGIKKGELMRVPETTIPVPTGALYFEVLDLPTNPLDTAKFELTGILKDVHRSRYAVPTENPNPSNPHVKYVDCVTILEILAPYQPLVGSVTVWAGSSNLLPDTYKVCDGTTLNVNTNPEYMKLYQTIGTAFGSVANAGEFKLPDLRDRFVMGVGAGGGTAFSQTGGETEITLAQNNLPNFTLPIPVNASVNATTQLQIDNIADENGTGHFTGAGVGGVEFGFVSKTVTANLTIPAHNHGGFTDNPNFPNNPIDVINPYMGLFYIIKVK